MLKLLTAEQMRRCDRAAIDDHGVPDRVLMENAGVQVVEAMQEFFADEMPVDVLICCGKGNNGGDGLVVARHLHNLGVDVRVLLFTARGDLEGSPAANLAAVETLEIDLIEIADADAWERTAPDLSDTGCIVDALFGTGITGALRGHFADVVAAINASGVPVVAVDLPSGLQADTGEVEGAAVVADLTVTLGAAKLCHALPPAEDHCGELGVVDIGIPEEVLEAVDDPVWLLSGEGSSAMLPVRERDSHKGDFGRILVVAGATGTAGAATLTALGALRGGAGLVTVATPESVYPLVGSQLVESLVRAVPAGPDGGLAEAAVDEILEMAAEMDVLAIGPGVGTSAETVAAIRRLVAEAPVPAVVDADGLNCLAGADRALEGAAAARILTPHPGEMARLTDADIGAVQADRLGVATNLAGRAGAIVLLKGYRTVIAAPDGSRAINPTGNPGMASGGSGDVLTGLVAALVGQGLEPFTGACVGAFVHGLAGDIAAEAMGERALIAGDLVDHLADAFCRLEALADAGGWPDLP